jgi:hypothetical protein
VALGLGCYVDDPGAGDGSKCTVLVGHEMSGPFPVLSYRIHPKAMAASVAPASASHKAIARRSGR